MQMSRPMTFASVMSLSTRVLLAALIGLEPGLMSLAQATPVPASERVVPPLSPTTPFVAPTPADELSLRDAPSDPAPEGSPPLRVAAEGVTAIAGRVLAMDGTPLQGVTLRMGMARAQTDEHGLYLLERVSPGEAVLVIDGRKAREANRSEAVDHGIHETRVKAEEGRTTALPWVSWLPRIDHAHETVLGVPLAEDAVATTPSVPGLELRIPKGAVLTGIDGEAVTRVSLTAIPVNRPPFPLPRHVEVPIYFTAQPGGAVISSTDGQWLGMQVVYPNYGRELPKARGVFWRYEPDGLGWSAYGAGSVSTDGQQVVPDPDTRVYALSGAMFSQNSPPPPACVNTSTCPPPPPPPPNMAPAPPPPGCCDPVDLASGLFVQTDTDLSLGGVTPLQLRRTYRPGDYNRREFGVGMSLIYGTKLYSANQYQQVDLVLPDGGAVHYTRIIDPNNPTDNGFITAHFTTNTPGAFYQSRIDWNGNGWNLIRTDGVMYVFGENAPLQYIQDRFGNKVTLTRSNGISGNITQVSGSNGRFIRFTYNGNNCITQAVDNIGRTVSYTYDSSSRLATVTDANGGLTTYTWDSSNRIQSIKDARGITYLTNAYDTADRVVSQTLADGGTYTLAYSIPPSGGSSGPYSVTVTDPRGIQRNTTFNSAGYTLADTFAVGTPQQSSWTYVRDPVSNFPTSITDPLGRRTDLTYDAAGNVLSTTRLAGTSNAITTSNTYDPVFNQLTSFTDPLGHVTTYQRNSLGLLAGVTDANGNSTTYTYNGAGSPVTATDALNNITQLNYGLDGDLVSVTDPLGRLTKSFTDAIGRSVRTIDSTGGLTQATHDPIYGVLQTVNGNGATVTNSYTPIGQLADVTDPRGGKIAYTYDSAARAATRIDPLNVVSSVTQRDAIGNVTASTDRKGQATSITYDALNRLSSASYADGSTVAFTWDLAGRLTQVDDSAGGTVSRGYDGLDRVTSETTSQGTISYAYDAAGRRLTMQAGSQPQVSYSYDNGNRLTAISQGSTTVTFGYDAGNRRTSATLPGGVNATYTWDAASQLTAITYANGSTTLGTLTYGYDVAGQIISRGGSLFQSILPAPVTSESYDLANRLTSRTAGGITTTPAFDANGNLTSDGARTFVWDARDRLTNIAGVASFTYDNFNRRKSITQNGATTSYLYDGWEVSQEQQNGSPSADLLLGLGSDERFSRAGSTLLTDALGSTVALASGTSVQTTYGYDAYGATQVTGAASNNPFQFTGRENDNTGLYQYRNRYYHPGWGRFISEDPIGLDGGDVNLYRYVGNRPVQYRDPTGNFADVIVIGGGLIVIGGGYLACRAMGGCRFDLPPLPCFLGGACPNQPPRNVPKPTPQTGPGDPCESGSVFCAKNTDSGKKRRGADAGPPCSGRNSDCSGGSRGTYPDPTQPGRYLCPDCFKKTFGYPPSGTDIPD